MSAATDFWQEHQVAGAPADRMESDRQLALRAKMFPLLNELMPTHFPGQTILDFGCGPGHDTILLLNNGARHVYYADVSWRALSTTTDRLKMHGYADLGSACFADDAFPFLAVEHAHCAGVLHHMEDPIGALARIRMVSPSLRVMVYDGEKSEHTQSKVPITEWWTPKEFLDLAEEAGWEGQYVGSYECSSEWRPNCWAACFSLS